jgi:hypothetical protein
MGEGEKEWERENLKKKKMGEGEEEWERRRGRVRERMSKEKNIKWTERGIVKERENYKKPKQKKSGRRRGIEAI